VPRVNIVLSDFRVEEGEVLTVAIYIVSLVTIAVYSNALFRCKIVIVAF
jgi:hypothetical protein